MLDDTKFSTKQELYDWIKENPNGYHRILKSSKLYKHVQDTYKGTKNIGENFWLYCHNYSVPLTCSCGSKLLFENIVSGYKSSQCRSCYKNNRKENSKSELTKKQQAKKEAPKCANEACDMGVSLKKDGTWSQYCSVKCRGIFNSLKSREKSRKTMLQNHGVEHALQSDTIYRQMIEKNKEKYGVENVMQNTGVAPRVIKTKIEKYGCPSSWSLSYQDHVDSVLVKFGYKPGSFKNVSQIPEIQEKKLKSSFLAKNYTLPSGNIIRIQGYENKFLDKALSYYSEDNFCFDIEGIHYVYNAESHFYFPDFIFKNNIIEVKSDYTFYSDYEKNLAKAAGVIASGKPFIFNIIVDTTQNYLCITQNTLLLGESLDSLYLVNKYRQFNNYIVDYFIPEKNIAILIRHPDFTDEIFVEKQFYRKMYLYFEEKGIQLITVFEHEINSVWLRSLTSKIHKNTDKIYARNTVVKKLENEAFMFLNKYHVQGFAPTSMKYGLFHREELVAVMCFSRSRAGIGKKRGDNCYELVRYATSKSVIGGASKLLTHFIKNHNPSLIYSYSDNSISNGNMYKKLGFHLECDLEEDYRYIGPHDKKLYHRFGYRKGALKDMPIYDNSLSEREIMKLNGFRRIYDSGKKTWILNIHNT